MRTIKTESPDVGRAMQRKTLNYRSTYAAFWAVVNVVLTVLTSVEMSTNWLLAAYVPITLHQVVWYTELLFLIIFALSAMYDSLLYWQPRWSSGVVELTQNQIKLLGVHASELGFKLRAVIAGPQFMPTVGPKFTSSSPYTSRLATPSPLSQMHDSRMDTSATGAASYSFMGLPYNPYASPGGYHFDQQAGGGSHENAESWSPYYRGGGASRWSPVAAGDLHYRGNSLHDSSVVGDRKYSPGYNYSWQQRSPSLDVSGLSQSLNSSNMQRHSPTIAATSLSPLDTGTRLVPRRSPIGDEGFVTSQRGLEKLLREEEERERMSLPSPGSSVVQPTVSYWGAERGFSDYVPQLKRLAYQPACKSPLSPKVNDEVKDNVEQYETDKFWLKLGVGRDRLDRWLENIRKWLSETIVVRLVAEIDKANQQMAAHGIVDCNVGEATISQLRQVAASRAQMLPTLHMLVPFLDVTSHQEYLVYELRELAKGGCLSAYRWNRGSEFKGRAWNEQLPTDAEIIIHVLCCYMDGRLPLRPHSPDGRPFTQLHFTRRLTSSSKSGGDKQTQANHSLAICQTSINPPHFNVVDGQETWNLPKGPSNLFQAILLFLHLVRTREHGMLGSVNLGLSGINVLWTLDA